VSALTGHHRYTPNPRRESRYGRRELRAWHCRAREHMGHHQCRRRADRRQTDCLPRASQNATNVGKVWVRSSSPNRRVPRSRHGATCAIPTAASLRSARRYSNCESRDWAGGGHSLELSANEGRSTAHARLWIDVPERTVLCHALVAMCSAKSLAQRRRRQAVRCRSSTPVGERSGVNVM